MQVWYSEREEVGRIKAAKAITKEEHEHLTRKRVFIDGQDRLGPQNARPYLYYFKSTITEKELRSALAWAVNQDIDVLFPILN